MPPPLVIGAVASAWLALRATRAEEEQARERERAEAGERSAQRLLCVANMNLAQHAWEQNNAGFMRELLDETAAYPDRGFEWYYWQRQTHADHKTLSGSCCVILSVAFASRSPITQLFRFIRPAR